jgi:hypothetical protein
MALATSKTGARIRAVGLPLCLLLSIPLAASGAESAEARVDRVLRETPLIDGRRGWTDSDVAKLAGGNLLRVMAGAEQVAAGLREKRNRST